MGEAGASGVMKILFWGVTWEDNGPANINKGIVRCGAAPFVFVRSAGKYRRLLEALRGVAGADAVLVSGVGRQQCLLVAAGRLLRKKTVYLMHGCNEQEYRINACQPDRQALACEAFLLKKSHAILTVSRRYLHWFNAQYPQYAHKTDYVYNGVDRALFAALPDVAKEPGTVAAAGGMSLRKNNAPVARAVEQLGGQAVLRIYGGEGGALAEDLRYTQWVGAVEHRRFLAELSRTAVFVLNSRQESFSIAALEALACGCSLLVSQCAGVSDLLALEESDIIRDPMDTEEIRRKIAALLACPNHRRLYEAFDAEKWSFEKMVLRLEEKCRALVQKN